MGQGNLQVDLREKKKRDEKKCNPNDVSLKVAIKAIKASYKSHYQPNVECVCHIITQPSIWTYVIQKNKNVTQNKRRRIGPLCDEDISDWASTYTYTTQIKSSTKITQERKMLF